MERLRVKEFWRRWHISLTSWFTDYLYIPLGGNRKGAARKYINIIIVFGVSGLWHGANWNFVVWGLIHAIYQIIGDIKGKFFDKVRIKTNGSISARVRQGFITFILVDIAWVFFAADSLQHAFNIFKQMFTCFMTFGIESGLSRGNWLVLMSGIALLFTVDFLHEKGISITMKLDSQELWFRYLVWVGMIWTIIILGIYGKGYDASQFIYFQF